MGGRTQDRHEQLLRSAVELFARDGIAETSTGNVARAAGVAAGTLFNYFPTKQDLISSAYLDCKRRFARHVATDINPRASFEELLEHVWTRGIEWALAHLDEHDFSRQFACTPESRSDAVREVMRTEMAFVYQALAEAQAAGAIVALPGDFLDRVFAALFEATVAHAREQPKRQRATTIRLSFELLLRALQP